MKEEGDRTGFVTPPFATLAQPIEIQNRKRLAGLPKTYIYCSSPATGSFDQFAAKLRDDPAWHFHELKTGHDAMILTPEALGEILLQTAARG